MRFRSTPLSLIGKCALAAVGIAALVAPATLPAAAAPPPPGAAFGVTAEPPMSAVTLITGDRVVLHPGKSGPVVEFLPAPRDSGEIVGYTSYGDDEHFYVIPTDVADLIPGRLDRSLFDVTALAEVQDSDRVPVIVQSTTPTGGKTDASRWKKLNLTATHTLESIDAVAGEVNADDASALLGAASQKSTVRKIWLDAPIHALDVESMPQIGAPAAWEAGHDGAGAVVAVLDTGIDTTHPDLDGGLVVGARDFTGSGSTRDEAGHGTHVASIVAGSGEASDGANRGVAYGAKLLNGRVLDARGSGQTSWIIEAMEWAAQEGADVINMSLGIQGEYTDGTDPGALAIDSISERYDTLVVVAAGNDGFYGAGTITSPGASASALTVGALNKSDELAGFSSRGPRFGDAGVKPDVTAPGEGILAARAAGTGPDGSTDPYLSMDGTSMAAPHVAGAAAILKAARPELDGEALKALLMGTAESTVGDIWKEGSGKIGIPQAIAEPLYASTPSLSVGVFASPRAEQKPRTVSLDYANTSDKALTLHLSETARGADGALPDETVELATDTLTVPAHGSASVEVTVDPRVVAPGYYTGAVVASGEGFAPVRTVMGWQVEPNLAALHLEARQPDGSPVIAASDATLYNLDDPSAQPVHVMIQGGEADLRLPPARYAILGTLANSKPDAELIDGLTLFTRDLDLTELGDHRVVIDGAKAEPVRIDTEKKSQVTNIEQVLKRTLPGRDYPVQQAASASTIVSSPGLPDQMYMLYDGKLAGDKPVLTQSWLLAAPKLDVVAKAKSETIDLSTELRYAVTSPELRGKVNAQVVAAGTGTPAELTKAGVKGKIALVEARPNDIGGVMVLNGQSDAAKAAGAIGLIVYGAHDGPYWEDIDFLGMGVFPNKQLPTLTLSREKGLELAALASTKKGVTLTGTGYGYPSYDYALAKVVRGVPKSLTFRLDAKNTASVQSAVRGQRAGSSLQEWHMAETDESYIGFNRWLDEPIENRTIHYYADPEARYQVLAEAYAGGSAPTPGFPRAFEGVKRSYKPGETATETLIGAVVHGGLRPNPVTPGEASVRREGDILWTDLPLRVDGEGNASWGGPDAGTTSWFSVWMDGTRLTQGEWPSAAGEVASGEHTFRMRLDVARFERWWTQATEVHTEWTFRSDTTKEMTALPVLQLDYNVKGLSPLNATSGTKITLEPKVSHQDGSRGSAIGGLKLWASYDGGTWEVVKVKAGKKAGEFTAALSAPKGTGSVSLKSEAWDADGNTFSETVIDAFPVGTK